jgi:hypothetical protein
MLSSQPPPPRVPRRAPGEPPGLPSGVLPGVPSVVAPEMPSVVAPGGGISGAPRAALKGTGTQGVRGTSCGTQQCHQWYARVPPAVLRESGVPPVVLSSATSGTEGCHQQYSGCHQWYSKLPTQPQQQPPCVPTKPAPAQKQPPPLVGGWRRACNACQVARQLEAKVQQACTLGVQDLLPECTSQFSDGTSQLPDRTPQFPLA